MFFTLYKILQNEVVSDQAYVTAFLENNYVNLSNYLLFVFCGYTNKIKEREREDCTKE